MIEYTVWGVVGDDPEERLLRALGADGKPIMDDATAKAIAAWCTAKGAKSVRIMRDDGSPPNFAAAINIGKRAAR